MESSTIAKLIDRAIAGEEASPPSDAILARIMEKAATNHEIVSRYHPAFGLEDRFPQCDRRYLLDQTLGEIVNRLKAGRNASSQARIMEAGCNLGFVTLSLAQFFPIVIGVEIEERAAELAQLLRSYNSSRAVITKGDAFSMLMEENAAQLIDCFVCLNVVHQVIFSRGLEATQTLLRHITHNVDISFFEFANKSEYIVHNRAHLLPSDPLEVFAKCDDISINFIRTSPRVLVQVTRTAISLDLQRLPIAFFEHKHNSNLRIARKLYYSNDVFIKQYRFNAVQKKTKLLSEAQMLTEASCISAIPSLRGIKIYDEVGYVLQERIYAKPLSDSFHLVERLSQTSNIIMQYISIARRLADIEIYHNDLSAHNLLYKANGDIILIDFEQASHQMIIDHFFLFAWLLYDLLAGREISYLRDIYSAVRGNVNAKQVDRKFFPCFDIEKLPMKLGQLVSECLTGTDWVQFVRKWDSSGDLPTIAPLNWSARDAKAIKLSDEEAAPFINAEDVRNAFIRLLGRPVTDASTIAAHVGLKTKSALERQLKSSKEYHSRMATLSQS